MRYIDIKKLNKFWDILSSKGACISLLYGGDCSERDVYVRRVSKYLGKGLIMINREVSSSAYYYNGQVFKVRESFVYYFKDMVYVNTYEGARIKFRDYVTMRSVTLSYNDLLNLQYKYLDNDEGNRYWAYQELLRSRLEREDVLYISKGSDNRYIERLFKKYHFTLDKIYKKMLRQSVKDSDIYLAFGNTNRFNKGCFYKDADIMFNIVNIDDYTNNK